MMPTPAGMGTALDTCNFVRSDAHLRGAVRAWSRAAAVVYGFRSHRHTRGSKLKSASISDAL